MKMPVPMFPVLLALLAFAPLAHADSVKGTCQVGGRTFVFTSGIAYLDARNEEDETRTIISLTTRPLDRAALAKCVECHGEVSDSTIGSPRGRAIREQSAILDAGYIDLDILGSGTFHLVSMDTGYVVKTKQFNEVHYLFDSSGMTESVALDRHDAQRIVGRIAREEGESKCEIDFDLAVGWPKK